MSFQTLAVLLLALGAAGFLLVSALGPLVRRRSPGCASGCGGCPSSRTCGALLEDSPRKS